MFLQEGDQFQFTHLLIGKDILMKWHNYSLLNVLQSLMDKALKRYHKSLLVQDISK
ncbi:hypothetical protein SPJ1_1833 [Streptococcus parauberis KRS-02083]|uniref:Uncharacterized protein n=1 Tax=Streptococcus parauberis KRS-02083 TaxID=1207545 RepID=A0ABN0IQ86_9STRE|nr:hypothetical protein SPJ1_1833 [Streptococcus parauberis KRS-02083]